MIKWNIKHYQYIDSTQSQCIKQALELQHGDCIYSSQQSSGTGREQKSWESREGGLYCSFLIKPESLIPELPFVLWWSVLESLEKSTGHCFQLKAPNDILYQQKKVAGLLIDSKIQGDQPLYYVCGIGINVNQTVFQGLLDATAISLRQICQKEFAIDMLLKELLRIFNEKYSLLESGEFHKQIVQSLNKREVQISYADAENMKFEDYWYAKRS